MFKAFFAVSATLATAFILVVNLIATAMLINGVTTTSWTALLAWFV